MNSSLAILLTKFLPCDYYNLLNYDYDNGKNIPGHLIEDALLDNKGVKYLFIPIDENINYEVLIHDNDSLTSKIDSLQNKMMNIKWVDNENEGRKIEGVDA